MNRRSVLRCCPGISVLVATALTLACGSDGATSVRLSVETLSLGACEEAIIEATVSGKAAPLHWRVEGYPLLLVESTDDGAGTIEARLRAPSVARSASFTLVAEAGNGRATATVSVTPDPTPVAGLARDMVPDCGPFAHGVASGDPTSTGVVLWTRYDGGTGDATLRWEVSNEPSLASPRTGTAVATMTADHTVHVAVDGLEPGTTYYYRFVDEDGTSSVLGRTKTAPEGRVEHLRMAVASCSSIYSGWFNAYRRIADRADLDLVIHLGDYIYDFVDENERVRVPTPEPVDPANVDEWRGRHSYYAMDPDFRLARAMHPWFILWDNHDVEGSPENAFTGSVQAFREWTPIRQPVADDPTITYRALRYGDLLDLLFMDILLFRNRETLPDSEARSMLGARQYDWLTGQLADSEAAWRVLGGQKLFSTLLVDSAISRSGVFGTNSWDAFPEARSRLYGFLADRGVDDLVVLSGDAHFSIANDIVEDPPSYDRETGVGSLGVEFLPTSISRGNFDEQLGPNAGLVPALRQDTEERNAHNAYLELTEHGYGLLDIDRDRVVAEYWYSPILEPSDEETFATGLVVERGANRWTLAPRSTPTDPAD